MRLDELRLQDFLTYDNLVYKFEKRPLLVQGLNLTDDEQKTNGTGKSGLQTGVEFCITASNSRDVRDGELVTYGYKFAKAELFASCDIRKQSIHIDWTIKVKGSNQLVLKAKVYGETEWKEIKFSNVNDGKKWILDWFDISREDLFNYYIINKTRFKSFFKSSNREKVDLINRFSDASIIEGLDNINIDDENEEYSEKERAVHIAEGKVELITDQIEAEKNRDHKTEMLEEAEDLEDEIEAADDLIVGVKEKIELKKKEIIFIKDQEIEDLKNDIITVEANKVDIGAEILTATKNIETVEKELKKAQKLIKAFVTTDWDKEREDWEEKIESVEENLEAEKKSIKKRESQIEQIKKLLNNVEITLSGKITCPKCTHEFVLEGDIDELKDTKKSALELREKFEKSKDEVNALISQLKENVKGCEVEVSKINKSEREENDNKNLLTVALNRVDTKLSIAQNKLKDLNQELRSSDADIAIYKNHIEACKASINNKKAEIINFEKEIENYRAEVKSLEKQIKNLKPGNSKETISGLKSNKKTLEGGLTTLKAKLAEIGDTIYKKNQWINNFKQFRMYLANQSLDAIEYHSNRYLKDMGSDLRIKMEGFKVLATGTIKEEITAKVIRDRERTFSSFSGGEQGRLLFASILANRHMINDTHRWGGLDFLFIDEVFEGVDSVGLKHLVKSAKTLNIPVMIITHVTDEEANSDRILIVKENGISKIKE